MQCLFIIVYNKVVLVNFTVICTEQFSMVRCKVMLCLYKIIAIPSIIYCDYQYIYKYLSIPYIGNPVKLTN